MNQKELPSTVTLLSAQNEKDIAEKVRLALEHLHVPFCESLLMDRTRLSKENARCTGRLYNSTEKGNQSKS